MQPKPTCIDIDNATKTWSGLCGSDPGFMGRILALWVGSKICGLDLGFVDQIRGLWVGSGFCGSDQRFVGRIRGLWICQNPPDLSNHVVFHLKILIVTQF